MPLADLNPDQTLSGRLDIDADRINELARNIASTGLINPITIRPTDAGFEVIAGVNRVAAVKLLGWTHVPANIQHANDLRTATIRLAENVQRSNLSPVEEATQIGALVETHPQATEGVARDLGRPLSWILDRLELLTWPEQLLRFIHAKSISLAAGKRLARIAPAELRDTRIEQAAHYHIDAKTAALWLQDSMSQVPQDFALPENTRQPQNTNYETTTTTMCFICRTRVDLQNTIPTHVCTNCLAELPTPNSQT